MDATMYRLVLLVFVIHASCASVTVGNDYILRIETMGYTDEPESQTEPREKTLHSIEVIARPDVPFRARVRMGAEAIVLAGKLRPADKGQFEVQFKYEHSVYADITVPGQAGSHEREVGQTSVQTSVTVPVDTRVGLGGVDSQESSPGEPLYKSKARHILSLTKHEFLSD